MTEHEIPKNVIKLAQMLISDGITLEQLEVLKIVDIAKKQSTTQLSK